MKNLEKLNALLVNDMDWLANLAANVGLHFIKDHLGVKPHQAVSIFNYLADKNKKHFLETVRGLIDDLMSDAK